MWVFPGLTPRFTVTYCDSTGPCAEQLVDCDLNSPDVVTDNLTGLVWSEDANLDGLKTWTNALTYTEDVTVCGYVDWRLPNSKELFSLIDRSQSGPALPVGYPFTNVQSAALWLIYTGHQQHTLLTQQGHGPSTCFLVV